MLPAVRYWILLSALLCGGGWILSAGHLLNGTGYSLLLAVAILAQIAHWRGVGLPRWSELRRGFHKSLRRFRRPAPLLFLVLFLLPALAGFIYTPHGGDTDSYRLPRVLHWLAMGKWHWIHTYDARMNLAGVGYEWLVAPLVLLLRSGRLFFLPNLISYALIPGLIFSVFVRLKIPRRVAWWWMWLLSSGWCYVFQAGATNNDSFAVVYALAAVDFALRARENRRISDAWFALLATALLTGTKQTTLPLVPVCAVALWPSIRLLLTRPLQTAAVCACGLLVSIAPVLLLNIKYSGNWTGLPPNLGPGSPLWANAQLTSPFWGIVGNAFCVPLQNLAPPFFPFVDQWYAIMQRFLHTSFGAHFQSFECFGLLNISASEASSGIGPGVFLLALASLAWACFRHPMSPVENLPRPVWFLRLLCLVPWLSLLLFMAKVGTYENARQLAPYYLLLFPLLLSRAGFSALTRKVVWQRLALVVMLLPAGLQAIHRQRPLFPVQTILGVLQHRYPDSKALARVAASFSIAATHRVMDRLFQNGVLAEEPVIGYATVTEQLEPSLWIPFRRRVERVLPEDDLANFQSRGFRYVAVDYTVLAQAKESIEQWTARYHGEVVQDLSWTIRVGLPTGRIYLVRLPDVN